MPTNHCLTILDGFSLTRPLPTQFLSEPKAKIVLYLRHDPQVYIPSPTLQKLLAHTGSTQQQQQQQNNVVTIQDVIQAVWKYVKAHQLLLPENQVIQNDALLKDICGTDKMSFSEIIHRVKDHLQLPEPIEIEHSIRVEDTSALSQQIRDVEVYTMTNTELPDILKPQQPQQSTKEIQQLNEQVCKIEKLSVHYYYYFFPPCIDCTRCTDNQNV